MDMTLYSSRADLPPVVSHKILFAALYALCFIHPSSPAHAAAWPGAGRLAQGRLGDSKLETITAITVAALGQRSQTAVAPGLPPSSPMLQGAAGPVYVALRARGEMLSYAWGSEGTWTRSLRSGLRRAVELAPPGTASGVDLVEICLTHSFRDLHATPAALAAIEGEAGLLGLELAYDGRRALVAPEDAAVRGLTFASEMREFQQKWRIPDDLAPRIRARVFGGFQVLVFLKGAPRAVQLERGHAYDEGVTVDGREVRRMERGLEGFLARSIKPDGSLSYLYEPARSTDTTRGFLMVRPLLATWVLGQDARRRPGPEARDAFARVLEHYVAASYATDGRLGWMVAPNGRQALGDMAMTGMAILDGGMLDRYHSVFSGLLQSVEYLQDPDGSFHSFLGPSDWRPRRPALMRMACESVSRLARAWRRLIPGAIAQPQDPEAGQRNYYPGEAVLFLARLYDRQPDAALLERIMRAFRYYREWHLRPANRAIAFVPWHTRAYCSLWKHTHSREFESFVFEMNDWLAGWQRWDDASSPDLKGTFGARSSADFPHVSSTGVYIESIAEAFALAKAVGDRARAARYRLVIQRGLRAVRRHQFRGPVDAWFVRNPERVAGGLRSNMHDPSIRIDSVSENLMALWRVQEVFSASDYLAPAN